jgi:fermentation-respiration switch protein FrsA (DUF1100 family)
MNMQIEPTKVDPEVHKANRRKSALAVSWRVIRVILVAYLVVVLLAMFFETKLMFPASRYPEGNWEPAGLKFEDVEFTADDGTKLHSWYVPADDPRAYVIYCHGNAGNITHRAEEARRLQQEHNISVLMLGYRGYGKSEGSPNEKGVIADARAARAWLAQREGIDEKDIVLMGRSLGGGVVVALAAEQAPRALILQNTFSSATDVAARTYWFLPVRLVMRNRFDSMSRIREYDGPLLQCHGTADRMLPIALGKKLFDASPSETKKWIPLKGYRHNDDLPAEYYKALVEFLDNLS